MITFAGLNIGVVSGSTNLFSSIRELLKENFGVESQWKKQGAKHSFTLAICPYAYTYNSWINNSLGEDFYEFETTNKIISSWNRYYENMTTNVVKVENLYTMDGQMQFIMDIAKKHSLKLGSYENRILWYGKKIEVIKDDLDDQQNKYITTLINRKITDILKYRIR